MDIRLETRFPDDWPIEIPGFLARFNDDDGPAPSYITSSQTLDNVSTTAENGWVLEGGAIRYAGASAVSYLVADSRIRSGVMKSTIRAIGQAGGGLAGRVTNINNLVRLNYRGSSSNRVVTMTNVVNSENITLASATVGPANGDDIEWVFNGNLLSVRLNGVQIIAPTLITDNLTATRFGLYGASADTTIRHDEMEFIPA